MKPTQTSTPGARVPGRHAGNLSLEGGRPCLDLVNTVDWRGTPTPQDYLLDGLALVDWCLHAGVLAEHAAAPLRAAAEAHPDATRAALAGAVALREALHRLFLAAAGGQPGAVADRENLHAALDQPPGTWRLEPGSGGWRWAPAQAAAEALAGLVRPLAIDAAALLASPDVARVRACGDAACGWLFLDTSRRGVRRWCNMASCGNRAKARRHYRRVKGRAAPASPA